VPTLFGTRARKLALLGVTIALVLTAVTVYYWGIGPSSTSVTPTTKTTTSASEVVESAINSTSACSQAAGKSWEGTGPMNTLRSNLSSQPEFIALAQNRTYSDAGYGCSLVNGTQFTVEFSYMDSAHPFQVCGSGTAYPYYLISAKVYLLPTGYDLSKTTYSTHTYDSQNLTVTCTSSTT
jgi:hypothetical protein